MNYVDALKLFGVEAKEIPCIKGNGAPPDTEGAVGCLYMDTDTGDVYKRTEDGWDAFVTEAKITEYVDEAILGGAW